MCFNRITWKLSGYWVLVSCQCSLSQLFFFNFKRKNTNRQHSKTNSFFTAVEIKDNVATILYWRDHCDVTTHKHIVSSANSTRTPVVVAASPSRRHKWRLPRLYVALTPLDRPCSFTRTHLYSALSHTYPRKPCIRRQCSHICTRIISLSLSLSVFPSISLSLSFIRSLPFPPSIYLSIHCANVTLRER